MLSQHFENNRFHYNAQNGLKRSCYPGLLPIYVYNFPKMYPLHHVKISRSTCADIFRKICAAKQYVRLVHFFGYTVVHNFGIS